MATELLVAKVGLCLALGLEAEHYFIHFKFKLPEWERAICALAFTFVIFL
ncbi:MAG: hypothetical protein WC607_00375 [Candidatus Micrarchaeia archaeon]